MIHKYFGNDFDLHSGGVDLVFPHHENEVAQSRCACGGGFARLWFHITHLLVDGGKMSKSLGNMYTLADLDKLGHRPSAVRYVLAGGYYRRPLNFTLSSLEDAKAALNRLSKFDMQLRNASGTDSVPSYEEFCAAFPELGIFQPAWDSLNDDLNTPEALGHVFSAIRKADIPSLSPEAAAACGMLSTLFWPPSALFCRRRDRRKPRKKSAPWRISAGRPSRTGTGRKPTA